MKSYHPAKHRSRHVPCTSWEQSMWHFSFSIYYHDKIKVQIELIAIINAIMIIIFNFILNHFMVALPIFDFSLSSSSPPPLPTHLLPFPVLFRPRHFRNIMHLDAACIYTCQQIPVCFRHLQTKSFVWLYCDKCFKDVILKCFYYSMKWVGKALSRSGTPNYIIYVWWRCVLQIPENTRGGFSEGATSVKLSIFRPGYASVY